MKKILLVIALLALAVGVHAQTAANRTAKTKISDALGLMPAPEQAEFDRLMGDLVSTGPEGIDMMTAMFEDTNNVPVNYALAGWAAYVTAPGREAERKSFAEGIIRALGKSSDPEIKAYYIRLLQRCGGSESVPVLAAYLGDERLGDPARSALTAIATPEALALVPASKKLTIHTNAPVTRIADLYAQVQLKGEAAIPQLLKALKSEDRTYRNAALRFIQPYLGEPVYKALTVQLKKAKPAVKADIITYLGLQGAQSALPQILSYIPSSDAEVSTAAMWAATRLEAPEAPAAIAAVMGNPLTPDPVREAAKACLLSTKGKEVTDLAAAVVREGCDVGKVDALSILFERRAADQVDVVLAATRDANPEVATAAYAALQNVVGPAQLAALYPLVEAAEGVRLELAQQAVIAALDGVPVADQVATIKAQMARNSAAAPRYYVVLAASGAPAALKTVTDGFQTGDAAAKAEALNALLAWKGLGAADELYKIAQSGDAEYADRALMGYVDQVAKSDKTREVKQIMLTEAMDLVDAAASKRAILRQMGASGTQQAMEQIALQKRTILKRMGETNTLQGMVLAGTYLDHSDSGVRQAAVDAIYNTALNRKDLYGPVIADLLTRAVSLTTSPDKRYQLDEVKKHIAAFPQQGGYVSMFNGKDYTGWKGLVENPIARGKMSPQELAAKQQAADEAMRRDWKVADGLLSFVGDGYDNICTDQKYGDFEMYVDWRLDPNGKEPDAGIYLRGTPQVQIWDTSRRNVGAEVGSGGLYNNKINESKPSHVADNRIGHWNTFRIKMVDDRVSVWLNGEQVVDNVIMENYWDRSLPIPAFDQIELQAHGSRVDYRNLYINALPRVEPYQLTADEQKEGFKILFDGTNMHSWTGNTRGYVSENGMISLYPRETEKGYARNLYTKDEYKDFVFRFEFKLTPGANNGLGIRTPMEGDAAYVGMELQILDNEAPIYKDLEVYQYHGSIYGVIPAKRGALKPVGEWNSQEVIAKGNHIKVTLNGEVILDGDIAKASNNGTATADHKEHPGLLNEKGHIGFLGHGSEVHFRNIRIKEL